MDNFIDKLLVVFNLKGYKYRAKMVLAALVILIVFIIIICSIIGKISSSAKKNKDSENISSQLTSSQVSAPPSVSSAAQNEAESSSASSSNVASKTQYEYDADGKIIIDTDTLDGKKAVAITFDDGPGEYTKELIEGLNKRNAKATFFMLGSCVEEYPEALPLMVEGGHQIGSHTYDHKDITSLTKKQLNEQLSKTDTAIYNACGQQATAFRPPYGSYEDNFISEINKTVALWSLDSSDWETKNATSVKNQIVSTCQDGDIILVHDIYKTSVDGALAAIDELQKQGYVFVTVDELLARYGHTVEHGKAYNAQFAVYETDSPYAKEYEAEMEQSRAAAEAQSAASAFYSSPSRPDSSDTTTSESSSSKFIY